MVIIYLTKIGIIKKNSIGTKECFRSMRVITFITLRKILTVALRVIVNNQFKENFYRKKN